MQIQSSRVSGISTPPSCYTTPFCPSHIRRLCYTECHTTESTAGGLIPLSASHCTTCLKHLPARANHTGAPFLCTMIRINASSMNKPPLALHTSHFLFACLDMKASTFLASSLMSNNSLWSRQYSRTSATPSPMRVVCAQRKRTTST
jgi:hypothetical protein